MFSRAELIYRAGAKKKRLLLGDPSPDGFSLQVDSISGVLQKGFRFSAELRHPGAITLDGFQLEMHPGLPADCIMLAGGFQSWSGSREAGAGDRIAPLFPPARPLLANFGDYRLHRSSGRRGRIHSWTYTCFTLPGGWALLAGSMDESTGYTLLEYDFYRDRLLIRKDCAGAHSPGRYSLLDLYLGWGPREQVLSEYFRQFTQARSGAPRLTGWTSWYNYYTSISEKVIRENVQALAALKLPLDVMQIDDGWQEGLGDWLAPNDKFPSGMRQMADLIRSHGLKPGLWLAPVVCSRRSRLAREHPQWLLRDGRGRPVRAGYNPLWGGWFYALDFYAPGFREHLRAVFDTALNRWGFDLLKLDFLYAAALRPREGRSRGGVMDEVMKFMRREAGEKLLLGCGVPLGAAFGRVDYCRIGSDVAPYWEDRLLKGIGYRERVSTLNSLRSTIARFHLDRRTFRNDPDVFLLRDGRPGVNLNRLTEHQRGALFLLNHLLGGLIFFSDDVRQYTPEQRRRLAGAYPGRQAEVGAVQCREGIYRFTFTAWKREYLALWNATGLPRTANLEEGPHFHPDLFVLPPGTALRLEPWQAICLHRVRPGNGEAYLLGASGHLYPGAQIEKLAVRPDGVTLHWHPHASAESVAYLAVPRGVVSLVVNGQRLPVILKEGIHCAVAPK